MNNTKSKSALFCKLVIDKTHVLEIKGFEVDDDGILWVHIMESGLWVSALGNGSQYSPSEKIAKAKAWEIEAARKDLELKAWSKTRLEILERDNHTCQVCDKKMQRLDIHHILPKNSGGTNHSDNLITVCQSCHKKIEFREILVTDRHPDDNDW